MLPLRLALRELRAGLRGFYVFIACIALGVAAAAAQDIAGTYNVSGKNPDGSEYSGVATISGTAGGVCGISCAAGIGGAGCMGLAWWEDDSRYDATVWDIKDLQSEGTIHADVKGRSVMPAIIIPLPFISHPQAHACRDLTKQLKQFLTTPEGYGGRTAETG